MLVNQTHLEAAENRRKVVVVGGGTGSHTVLAGLRHHAVDITAVVSVMDSGGSSGRLRNEYDVSPPGDARQCLVALSNDDETANILRSLFTYRFHGREVAGMQRPLDGHNLGNLFISALADITGSTENAYKWAGRLLNARGRVVPVSGSKVELCARLSDGHLLKGEAAIDVRQEHPEAEIDFVYLDHQAYPTAAAIEALRDADLVILGPGDLYTSIIPNLLVDGITRAMAQARYRVFVVNLMTKRGETDRYKASTFVERLQDYLWPAKLDAVVLNTTQPRSRVGERYAADGAYPVEPDIDVINTKSIEVLAEPLGTAGHYFRHDSHALADVLMRWLQSHSTAEATPMVLSEYAMTPVASANGIH